MILLVSLSFSLSLFFFIFMHRALLTKGLTTTTSSSPEANFLIFLFSQGVTARPGARFGPLGIRQGSRRIAPDFSWSVYTGQNPFVQGLKIVDCGDAPLTVLDNTIALRQLERAHKVCNVPYRTLWLISGWKERILELELLMVSKGRVCSKDEFDRVYCPADYYSRR